MGRHITIQDITWFLDHAKNNRLVINPPYQRNSVWTAKDRRFFLDTIFSAFPSPAIFLHKEVREDGSAIYNVVDGKQRLETILKFSKNQISVGQDFNDARLRGKKWRDIDDDELKHKFWDYQLNVEFVSNVENTLVNAIFERLNRNSRRLTAQEMRHAKYEGWLINIAEQEAEKQFWKDLKIATRSRSKRMVDVQFISELIGIVIDRKIIGFDQEYLDDLYARFEDLEELDYGFQEEGFIETFDAVKIFISEMERHNQSITNFADTFTHFYTLWGVISLKNPPLATAPDIANKYLNFIQEVSTISLISNPSSPNPAVLNYANNAVGASTEFPQREARHDALIEALGI